MDETRNDGLRMNSETICTLAVLAMKNCMHKRWFGSDVIAWLKKLISTGVNPSHTHNLDESFTAILVREEF